LSLAVAQVAEKQVELPQVVELGDIKVILAVPKLQSFQELITQ
jgi:hypothetical protein